MDRSFPNIKNKAEVLQVLEGRVSDCEELVWDEIQLPVQNVIRTFLAKKLWRPEQPYPRDCMAECRQKCRQMDFSKTGKNPKPW